MTRFALLFVLCALLPAVADDFAPFAPVKDWKTQGLPAVEGDAPTGVNPFAWLTQAQRPNGSWASPDGKHDIATTGLVVLNFLGNGQTHRFGKFKTTLKGAMSYLERALIDPPELLWLDRSVHCWALAEALAVSRDFRLKKHVKQSLTALLALRTAEGGWANGEGQAANTLATCFAVMALKAVKTAQIEVDEQVFERAHAVLNSRSDDRGNAGFVHPGDAASLAYGKAKGASGPLFTASALVARLFTGDRRNDLALRNAADTLLAAGLGTDEPLYTYFATYALFQVGGEGWDSWHEALIPTLLQQQVGQGENAGSWEPRGVVGQLCGRAGETALRGLTLELYYRYERATR